MEILKKGGTLRFWGDWFGRPYDNFHRPVSAELDGGVLTIRFDGGEKCVVFSPSGIVNEPDIFRVERAEKIIWKWYKYGVKQTSETLCKREYTRERDTVSVKRTGEVVSDQKSVDMDKCALELC